MKFTFKRNVRDEWQDCDITNLKKGDIFYITDVYQEGPFYRAKSDAEIRSSAVDEFKETWHIETEQVSYNHYFNLNTYSTKLVG